MHIPVTQQKVSLLFFLGSGLGSMSPCKSSNRNKINVKKYEMKNSILFNFKLVSLQMRAYT